MRLPFPSESHLLALNPKLASQPAATLTSFLGARASPALQPSRPVRAADTARACGGWRGQSVGAGLLLPLGARSRGLNQTSLIPRPPLLPQVPIRKMLQPKIDLAFLKRALGRVLYFSPQVLMLTIRLFRAHFYCRQYVIKNTSCRITLNSTYNLKFVVKIK